jgi:hypothetical protein
MSYPKGFIIGWLLVFGDFYLRKTIEEVFGIVVNNVLGKNFFRVVAFRYAVDVRFVVGVPNVILMS